MIRIESPEQRLAFVDAIARARAKLEPGAENDRVWPAIAAAALLGFAAMALATTAILAPPPHLTPGAELR